MIAWETLFGTTTSATDVTLPTGTPVVLHGCAQAGSTVNVRTIAIPQGAMVSNKHDSTSSGLWQAAARSGLDSTRCMLQPPTNAVHTGRASQCNT